MLSRLAEEHCSGETVRPSILCNSYGSPLLQLSKANSESIAVSLYNLAWLSLACFAIPLLHRFLPRAWIYPWITYDAFQNLLFRIHLTYYIVISTPTGVGMTDTIHFENLRAMCFSSRHLEVSLRG